MKIYLTASISQKCNFQDYYEKIYSYLVKCEHKIYTGNLFKTGEYKKKFQDQNSREKWYEESIKQISISDIVIVEISHPSSANIGHELSMGLEKGKPVIALFREDKKPIFLQGLKEERLILTPYNKDNLGKVLDISLKDALDQMDVRFNFFISPKIGAYLDWISKNQKTPRAVYLRRLIEEDMAKGGYESKEINNKNKVKKKK